MSVGNLTAVIEKNIKPILTEQGLELYYLEYVKENNENYLRIFIDKEEGVTINDCIEASKKVCEDYFNIEDPISEAYNLEVSSPGIERILYTEEHIIKYIGSQVRVDLKSLHLGRKKMIGELKENTAGEIVVEGEDSWSIPKDKIKRIKIKGEF